MQFKKINLIIFLALFVVACSDISESESDARSAVLAGLKDPDSAKFAKFTEINEKLACLTVNAKNSMGGYTGDQQAYLKKINGKWDFQFALDVSHGFCIENYPKILSEQ